MPKRRVTVVADDLGRSSSVNQAIAEAHDKGIVTSASIMAGGEAFEEAVEIAHQRKRLSVGLHVTLCDGKAVLGSSQIPDLVGRDGSFEKDPAAAGLRYTRRRLLKQIDDEIKAQFDRLDAFDIHPTHVDGHHHLHMHPGIFEIVCRHAASRGVSWVRIPGEKLPVVLRYGWRRGMMPIMEWAVFGILRMYNMKAAKRYGLNSAQHVYGLSRTGSLDEKFLLDILSRTRNGINEIFTHPDMATDNGIREFKALTSSTVGEKIASFGISLGGYREDSKVTSAFIDGAMNNVT